MTTRITIQPLDGGSPVMKSIAKNPLIFVQE